MHYPWTSSKKNRTAKQKIKLSRPRAVYNCMKHYFRIVIALFLSAVALCASAGSSPAPDMKFRDESLTYKVMYKWGLVNKQAGRATLRLTNSDNHYTTLLTARSEEWADRFYKVRDTLQGSIVRDTFKPVIYTKRAHEGDDNKLDIVKYSYTGAKTIGKCERYAWDTDGKQTRNEKRTLEAYGTTVDMLSSFYYMRALPYNTWKTGYVVSINIYSGKQKELLTIKYMGTERVSTDLGTYDTYHIRFTFTGDGGKKTSDDMDAWISTASDRVPVKLEGKLKVGKVQCFLTSKK